jgi:hypothetical protein
MYNEISLDRLCAALCYAMGIDAPEFAAKADERLTAYVDEKFGGEKADRIFMYNPDAIAQWIYEKYPQLFVEMDNRTELSLPYKTVMPSVTPVCFGTMYTGAQPSVHGIQKYEKPVIKIDTIFDAFIRAAQRGVDVRIILPGIPDKKIIYRISRSYYKDLIEAGVKIYEYQPGFVHAKAFIADDKIAGIGTVNLDYRSLFLHFECNSVFYKANIVEDLKKDFVNTQQKCIKKTLSDTQKGLIHKLIDNFLRVIAPLL